MKGKLQFKSDAHLIYIIDPRSRKRTRITRQDAERLADWIMKLPPVWQPKDPKLLLEWCETVLAEASDDLNEWESGFIDSIHSRLLNGQTLSPKQETHLERIYAEKTK